jgi:predicted enzyme related to lactoylglutathione lyase
VDSNHGKIWWTELITPDVEAAMNFYEHVAGWAWDILPIQGSSQNYYMALREGRPIAGCMGMDWLTGHSDMAPQWCNFISVDDVDKSARKSVARGGELMREGFDLRDIGRIALLRDPQGALIGLISPTRD